MARRYRVVVADAAKHDLRDIAEYIAHRDTASAARRQLARLATQTRALGTTPLRGRIPPELGERGLRTWREVVIDPWRIVYRIDGRTVYVLAVLDGRRDLGELLLRRLTRP
jgi:toxin ParE1/3/4